MHGSGVDLKVFSLVPFPQKPVRFLLVARLLGDKGIREYAASAERLHVKWPEAEFHLVGPLDTNPDGIKRDEVQAWQDAGNIIWQGELEDVRPAIAGAHVFVLPSYREGMPRTVLEAMSMGRPVITTDVPGCRETVVEGVNGFLVARQDIDELVGAMERFLVAPNLTIKMGANSRMIAEDKYDVHKVNAQMIAAMNL
ncbi:MAG: glycosyltransferase [Rhodothermales bacterium]